ncbi:MAG: glycosyltransferase [Solirubrobacterales bacterium]
MIVIGTAVTDLETYDRCAAPGIRLAAEPDSEVVAHQSAGSLFRNYNLLLDRAAARDDLEALVLVHQDAEIVDTDFCEKLRGALSDPEVAIVGCAGAVGVRGIAWWEGAVTWASFTHRYRELGGGEFPSLSWTTGPVPSFLRTGEVETIDGFVMAISPWAVRNLRFDESLGKLHGYDFDFCMQARAAGKKVVTQDLRVVHHHSLELIDNPEAWIEAYIRVAEKWDGRLPTADRGTVDWRQRAMRSEAEAAAAKGEAISERLQREATDRQLERVVESRSWRLTAPLRWPRTLLRRRG